ncbi:uncharacterized protein [Asterias amurensis]|uniref:uncharacterized protein n=1 Tax=Asterias amurensis TaxID=7602 RepID=UPI003AB31CF5
MSCKHSPVRVKLNNSEEIYLSTNGCPRLAYDEGAASILLTISKEISARHQEDIQDWIMIKELHSLVKVRLTISKEIYRSTCQTLTYKGADGTFQSKARLFISEVIYSSKVGFQAWPMVIELQAVSSESPKHLRVNN